jgi:sugar (pentulose or hexulose) kinase
VAIVTGVLALDIGTTALKAAVFLPDGRTLARVSRRVEPGPGPATQDSEALWRQAAALVGEAATAARRETAAAARLDGIVLTGQGDGLWPVGSLGEGGLAWQWNSQAGAAAITEWEAAGAIDTHFRRTGTVLWQGALAPLWRHLRETDPARAERTRWALKAKDWVGFKLTGEVVTDPSDATIPFLDVWARRLDPAAFDRLGCADLLDKIPEPAEPGTLLGGLTPSAAAATGLSPGTPVRLGVIDVVANALGAGARRAGDAVAVLGTTFAVTSLSRDPVPAGEPVGATVSWAAPGVWLRVLGSSGGAAVLDWFLRFAGLGGPDRFERFWELVESAPPGPELATPYLYGERAPFLAPHATGAFLGITPDTTLAALGRALVESLALTLRHSLDSAGSPRSLVVTGGPAADPRWTQLVADATGHAVTPDADPDLGCRGAASLVPGYEALAAARPGRPVVEPGPRAERLAETYGRHLEAVAALRPTWRGPA